MKIHETTDDDQMPDTYQKSSNFDIFKFHFITVYISRSNSIANSSPVLIKFNNFLLNNAYFFSIEIVANYFQFRISVS